jgi:hypothetical protein
MKYVNKEMQKQEEGIFTETETETNTTRRYYYIFPKGNDGSGRAMTAD